MSGALATAHRFIDLRIAAPALLAIAPLLLPDAWRVLATRVGEILLDPWLHPYGLREVPSRDLWLLATIHHAAVLLLCLESGRFLPGSRPLRHGWLVCALLSLSYAIGDAFLPDPVWFLVLPLMLAPLSAAYLSATNAAGVWPRVGFLAMCILALTAPMVEGPDRIGFPPGFWIFLCSGILWAIAACIAFDASLVAARDAERIA